MYTWLITIHNLGFRPLRIGLWLFQIPNGLNLWLINWGDPNHLRYLDDPPSTVDSHDDPSKAGSIDWLPDALAQKKLVLTGCCHGLFFGMKIWCWAAQTCWNMTITVFISWDLKINLDNPQKRFANGRKIFLRSLVVSLPEMGDKSWPMLGARNPNFAVTPFPTSDLSTLDCCKHLHLEGYKYKIQRPWFIETCKRGWEARLLQVAVWLGAWYLFPSDYSSRSACPSTFCAGLAVKAFCWKQVYCWWKKSCASCLGRMVDRIPIAPGALFFATA